jgi:hypothetical protein
VLNLLPKSIRIRIALALSKQAAERGKDSFFDRWWFFDTNCISELVKMRDQGFGEHVRRFVTHRDILITSSIVQELRHVPDILRNIDVALQDANLFLVADMTRFWYTDIANFLNVDNIPTNTLETYPAPPDFFRMVVEREDFEDACLKAEADVQSRFFSAIAPDIGSSFDERDLCIHIAVVINEYGKEWFRIDIPPGDISVANFPSFFTFFYTYYFRYMKQKVEPDLNDFIDLTNCLPLPYCHRFYGEKKFTTVLRKSVRGRIPPTAFQLAKRLYRKGAIDTATYERKRQNRAALSHSGPLLPNTEIFNFSEMRTHILDGSN